MIYKHKTLKERGTDMAAISIDGTPMTALPSDADQINYDNTSSGMAATQVQAAVDELKSGLTNFVKKATVTGTTNANGILDVEISGRNNTNTAIIEVIGVRESPYFSEFYTITPGTTLTNHWVFKLEYVDGVKLATQQVKIIVKYIEHN